MSYLRYWLLNQVSNFLHLDLLSQHSNFKRRKVVGVSRQSLCSESKTSKSCSSRTILTLRTELLAGEREIFKKIYPVLLASVSLPPQLGVSKRGKLPHFMNPSHVIEERRGVREATTSLASLTLPIPSSLMITCAIIALGWSWGLGDSIKPWRCHNARPIHPLQILP